MNEESNREARLRRLAKRKGLMLQKSRRRDPAASDYGRYFLIHREYNAVWGQQPSFGLSLDEIEEWLTDKSAKE